MVGPRIAPVFRDRDELPTTNDLGEAVRAALRDSATLVVICSPAAARSPWVREEIIARPKLHGRVRLVFISLDPAHDTPGMLRGFARRFEASASIVPWHFLTTYSNLFLKPVLRDMGEEISIDREASGALSGSDGSGGVAG